MKRDAAYRELQDDLARNMDLLTASGLVSIKELLATITSLEEFIKSDAPIKGETFIEVLANFLTGRDHQELIA
jgi:hypothetical protein